MVLVSFIRNKGRGIHALYLRSLKFRNNMFTKFCQIASFFFIGVEYVLVLPSLNGYLETLNIGSNYVGVCIAVVNAAALLTATPLGRLSGKISHKYRMFHLRSLRFSVHPESALIRYIL